MKYYLTDDKSELKIIGRSEDGRIVGEVTKDQLVGVVGHLQKYTNDQLYDLILLRGFSLVGKTKTHIRIFSKQDAQDYLNSLV